MFQCLFFHFRYFEKSKLRTFCYLPDPSIDTWNYKNRVNAFSKFIFWVFNFILLIFHFTFHDDEWFFFARLGTHVPCDRPEYKILKVTKMFLSSLWIQCLGFFFNSFMKWWCDIFMNDFFHLNGYSMFFHGWSDCKILSVIKMFLSSLWIQCFLGLSLHFFYEVMMGGFSWGGFSWGGFLF